jgi:valyl-tRNA synthetase
MTDLPKAYDPKTVEDRLYQFWMEGGYFTPQVDPGKQPFVIIMPPPNVTGELHLGHALTATVEDTLVRWHRMKGEAALWLPGSDHAGIATQVVVEGQLAKEGLSRHDLGREKFVERVWQWVETYGRAISQQHRKLGASCDWSRERFTLDPGPSRAVRTTFINLYRKGLIYRGERIINWCPRCMTALSDLEVEHQEAQGHLWYIHYPLASGQGHITVATTRSETMMGDTAVAVSPRDSRYRHLLGQEVVLPVVNRRIPIIADDAIDPAFGTGALKVTPAHDPTDFEIGQRHGLAIVNIFNPDGTLNDNAGPYAGKDRYQAREGVVRQLEAEGLLERTEDHAHSVGHCQRCRTAVEPWASQQWFVQMDSIARRAIEAVQQDRISIVPERFTRVYYNWLENIRDWCISRQLWWGHRIPVWYCRGCGHLTVAVDDPEKCEECGSTDIYQDPDVLDTWFSSGLWPHSTLGWPEDTDDLRYFYPTAVIETGYDILFFWVARMIMMGLENTGQVPFRHVYLHGLVRDEQGDKMSKIRGNVLNPLELIDRYGCDALRFALSTGTTPGNDTRLSDQKLEAGRNFANKLWNAGRLVLSSLGTKPPSTGTRDIALEDASSELSEDRWLRSRLAHTVAEVDRLMSEFQLGEAERTVHDFFWGEFCDWYLEMAKLRLRQGDSSPFPAMVEALDTSLRLLHPFMPFVTEELWQHLRPYLTGPPDSIMIAPYPTAHPQAIDPGAEAEMGLMMEVVRAIRQVRTELRLGADRWVEAEVHAGGNAASLSAHREAMESFSRARPLTVLDTPLRERPAHGVVLVLSGVEVVLPLEGVDLAAERKRLEDEMAEAGREISRLEGLLGRASFRSKAPIQVVEREQLRLSSQQERLERLTRTLSLLRG